MIAIPASTARIQPGAFRDRFHVPPGPDGSESVYFTGNSLGLQPLATRAALMTELDDWARLGVEGHFEGTHPWYSYDEPLKEPLARVVGALPHEVVAMNGLTVNLHLLLTSFYRPTPRRSKVVVIADAFASDRYAIASQIRWHGLDPADNVIAVEPEPGAHLVDDEAILETIATHGDSIALILISGVHYRTGQAFDFESITRVGHEHGCTVGFDLAHAAGNLDLQLHEWGVDFAAWCSYKYLNSGPGSVGCAFVHERHSDNPHLHRHEGWWGNDPATRFSMPESFVPHVGAAAWQLSNAPVFSMAPLRVSLGIFDEATMPALREAGLELSSALLDALESVAGDAVEVITPRQPKRRGCQLSLRFPRGGRAIQEALAGAGVSSDYRHPDVIRVAPAPLYNTVEECGRFAEIIGEVIRR